MRTKGRKVAIWGSGFVCGKWYTFLYGKKAFYRRRFCKRWSCSICHARKIEAYKKKIEDKCRVQVFVRTLRLAGRELSQFIRRNIEQDKYYMAVRLPDKTFIISSHGFDGARRKDRRNFLEGKFTKELNKIKSGIYISQRREERQEKRLKTDDSPYYGIVADFVKYEYEALTTDEERARYMFDKCSSISKGAEKFIEEYLYGTSDVTLEIENKDTLVRTRMTTIKA